MNVGPHLNDPTRLNEYNLMKAQSALDS